MQTDILFKGIPRKITPYNAPAKWNDSEHILVLQNNAVTQGDTMII